MSGYENLNNEILLGAVPDHVASLKVSQQFYTVFILSDMMFSHQQAMKAQGGSKGTALPFLQPRH